MTTIEEVVKMWDKTHSSNMQVVPMVRSGRKIRRGGWFDSLVTKEAVIELSKDFSIKHWSHRTCYVFCFNFDEQTDKLKSIEISFQRRIKKATNTQKFYEFLNDSFGKKFTLSKGVINPNHLILKKDLTEKSSAKDICESMEELIKLTQKPICKFLASKHKSEEPDTIEEIRNEEEEATATFFYDKDKKRAKRLSEKGDGTPKEEIRQVKFYIRNADVIAEVLKRAKGICAKCGKKPFKREQGAFVGQPYLEVHHKIWLSEGGSDNVQNAVALCPNCHKEEHYGKRFWKAKS